MDTSTSPSDKATRDRAGLASTATWMLAIGAIVYLLSFGPVHRLTHELVTDSSAGVYTVRNAPFPRWRPMAHFVYLPLYSVLSGNAGRWPRDMLQGYVRLWG